jgi:hypothetical protein
MAIIDRTGLSFPHEALEASVEAARQQTTTNNEPATITMNAVVLTAPIPLSNADLRAFFGGTAVSDSDEAIASNNMVSRFMFKARLLRKGSFNPHVYLQDPCDASAVSGDAFVKLMSLISLHTSCLSQTSYNGKLPKIGDIVEIELRKETNGPSFWYNIQSATFKNIVDSSVRSIQQVDAASTCGSLSAVFQNQDPSQLASMGNGTDPGTFYWSGRKKQKKVIWSSTEFPGPNGSWTGTEIRNGDIGNSPLLATDAETGATLLSPAMDDFKLLAAAYKAKFGKVLIVSGYRTYSSQVNVRMIRAAGDHHAGGDGTGNQEYDAAGNFVGFAAVPGTSNHGWAAAVDINRQRSLWSGYPFPGKDAPDFLEKNRAPVEFRWLNKYASKWHFVFGVRNEHWHLDWTKFSAQVTPKGVAASKQNSWGNLAQQSYKVTLV